MSEEELLNVIKELENVTYKSMPYTIKVIFGLGEELEFPIDQSMFSYIINNFSIEYIKEKLDNYYKR